MFIRIVIVAATLLASSACSVLNQADDRRAAERACGVDMLKDPTLEQLYCMEEKGKDMPNYQSLAHKIEEKKRQESDSFEAKVNVCKVTDLNSSGGTIEAPRTHPIPFIKEQARRHCEKQNLNKFRILNIQVVKKPVDISTEAVNTSGEKPKEPQETWVQQAKFECQ